MIFSSPDRPASSSSRLRRIAQADPSATESPHVQRSFFSPNSEAVCEIGARGRASRIRGHCSSAAPVAYIEPEWTLVPGPFLCVMANSGCFAAAGTAMAVMAPGRTKSGVGGHQSVQGTVIKLPGTKAESVEGWPAERGKKQVEVPHPAGRVFAARRLSRLGRSGARPLTNFTFWGRLPPKYAGRATRTERELNVD
jgi:hypothetical protein